MCTVCEVYITDFTRVCILNYWKVYEIEQTIRQLDKYLRERRERDRDQIPLYHTQN